jgi:hypothetical protein
MELSCGHGVLLFRVRDWEFSVCYPPSDEIYDVEVTVRVQADSESAAWYFVRGLLKGAGLEADCIDVGRVDKVDGQPAG